MKVQKFATDGLVPKMALSIQTMAQWILEVKYKKKINKHKTVFDFQL